MTINSGYVDSDRGSTITVVPPSLLYFNDDIPDGFFPLKYQTDMFIGLLFNVDQFLKVMSTSPDSRACPILM